MAAKTATAGTIQTITGETLQGQIGSGTVESAANTVIHHRLKRPGRGWTRDNAQAMRTGPQPPLDIS